MSAYDNPTIIKDNTAEAWAQVAGGFGESFAKSFAQAKESKEAKDRQAMLDAERRRKESDQLLINMQRERSNIADQNEAARIKAINDAKLSEPVLMSQFSTYIAENNEKIGEFNAYKAWNVVGRDEETKNSNFESSYNEGRQKSTQILGAIQSQINSFKEDSVGDMSNIAFRGKTPVERMTNFYTLMGLDSNNEMAKGVSKSFEWDKEDPKNTTLAVATKFKNEAELKDKIKAFMPGASSEDIQKEIDSSNNIKKNDDGSYSLEFKQQIGNGTYDGIFYDKVPALTAGTELEDTGIYTNKGLNYAYIGDTVFLPVEGNAGKDKTKKVTWQGTVIETDKIKRDLRPAIEARVKGLIDTDFQSLSVLQGFLTNKAGAGAQWSASKINELEYSEKVKTLTDLIMSQELANRFKSFVPVKDNKTLKVTYYAGNPQKTQTEDLTKGAKAAGGATGTAKNQAALNEKIRNVIRTKQGGVPGKGGYTLQIIDGRWGVYDKDGIPKVGTEDITDPSVLATFIGGTIDQ